MDGSQVSNDQWLDLPPPTAMTERWTTPWNHLNHLPLDLGQWPSEDTDEGPHQLLHLDDASVTFSAESENQTTFFSAPSEADQMHKERMQRLRKETDYEAFLKTEGVGSVDPKFEQDWSGRGQHAEFQQDEANIINELLKIQDSLGKGNSAVVHSVKCRQILLARKTIHSNRYFTKRQAIKEVAHLTRLRHSHVVRLIGTYTWQNELSTLMYPATQFNLAGYLDFWSTHDASKWALESELSSCHEFFPCLSSALFYIHQTKTKHMDVKPRNILVRTCWEYKAGRHREFVAKVYISDFGVSRKYDTHDAIDTDGITNFTRKYAAPQVVQQDFRGLPADIFSMACVFLEIFVTLHDVHFFKHKESFLRDHTTRLQLDNLLSSSADSSYQNHIELLHDFLKKRVPVFESKLALHGTLVEMMLSMISRDPKQRPTALDLTRRFPPRKCCTAGPEELERIKYDTEGQMIMGDIEGSTIEESDREDHFIVPGLIRDNLEDFLDNTTIGPDFA